MRARRFARRRRAVPRTDLRAGHLRRFEHALRADDDVRQVELHVRERAEERRVELTRPPRGATCKAGRRGSFTVDSAQTSPDGEDCLCFAS